MSFFHDFSEGDEAFSFCPTVVEGCTREEGCMPIVTDVMREINDDEPLILHPEAMDEGMKSRMGGHLVAAGDAHGACAQMGRSGAEDGAYGEVEEVFVCV